MDLKIECSNTVAARWQREGDSVKCAPVQKMGQSDALCSLNVCNVKDRFKKGFERTRDFFSWIYGKVISLLQRVFFCFSSTKSLLKIFKRDLELLRELSEHFPINLRRMQLGALKNWWAKEFQKLDPKVQRLLLLQEVVCHATDGVSNREAWAEEHFKEYETIARNFVVDLGDQTISGKTFHPTEALPAYIGHVKEKVAAKIKELEKKAL